MSLERTSVTGPSGRLDALGVRYAAEMRVPRSAISLNLVDACQGQRITGIIYASYK